MLAAEEQEHAYDRVDWHLSQWVKWMRKGRYGKGYPTKTPGLSGGWATKTFEEMVESTDDRCAAITDAVIRDLSPAEQSAIHAVHLAAVYTLREPIHVVYERARERVRLGLEARGVW